ncbi:hypothetical protein TB2_005850 [Malus domestica]
MGAPQICIMNWKSVANFVGKPAAVVFGMGYVTNYAILPVLMGKGGLIVSDFFEPQLHCQWCKRIWS